MIENMKKILVAEDDKFLAGAYKLKLIAEGFAVEIVKDGQELLRELPTFQPDLIILDLIMPRKDGFAVLQELHNNPTYSTIPVIVASNLGQKEDIDRAMQFGVKDFFVKSDLSIDELVAKIRARLPQ